MVQIELRDLDIQLANAQRIADKSQQDQVIYKSTDRNRYEIYLTAPKEGFTGNIFRVVRHTREDKRGTVLRNTEDKQPDVVSKTAGIVDGKGRKKSK